MAVFARLELASKRTCASSTGEVGDETNAGTRPAGGLTTPWGTSRTVAVRAIELPKSPPIGVAAMVTICSLPLRLLGGAVYVAVARPSLPVTTVRADRLPKSTSAPLTRV